MFSTAQNDSSCHLTDDGSNLESHQISEKIVRSEKKEEKTEKEEQEEESNDENSMHSSEKTEKEEHEEESNDENSSMHSSVMPCVVTGDQQSYKKIVDFWDSQETMIEHVNSFACTTLNLKNINFV
jgi:seryl-tRNA synthetase